MPLKADAYLRYIAEAADRIEQFIGTATFANYCEDALLRSAVERQFIIIGEAVSQIANSYPVIADRITNRQLIVGFRNILVHRYFYVDDSVVWQVVNEDLPLLRDEVATLLAGF